MQAGTPSSGASQYKDLESSVIRRKGNDWVDQHSQECAPLFVAPTPPAYCFVSKCAGREVQATGVVGLYVSVFYLLLVYTGESRITGYHAGTPMVF